MAGSLQRRAGAVGVLLAAGWVAAAAAAPEYLDRWVVDDLQNWGVTQTFYRVSPPRLAGQRLRPGLLSQTMALPTSPRQEQQAQAHFDRAQEYLRAQEFEKALLELRDALGYLPDHPLLQSSMAQVALQVGDERRADTYLQRVLERQPNDLYHLTLRANLLLRLSRFDETRALADRIAELQPNSVYAALLRTALDFLERPGPLNTAFWRSLDFGDLYRAAEWTQMQLPTLARMYGNEDTRRFLNQLFCPAAADRMDELTARLRGLQEAAGARKWNDLLTQAEALLAWDWEPLALQLIRLEALSQLNADPARVADGWKQLKQRYPRSALIWIASGNAHYLKGRHKDAVSDFRRAEKLTRQSDLTFMLVAALALNDEMDPANQAAAELLQRQPDALRQLLTGGNEYLRGWQRLSSYQNILRRLGIPPELE